MIFWHRLRKSAAFWLGVVAIVLVILSIASGLKHWVLVQSPNDQDEALLLPKLGSQLDNLTSVTIRRGSAVVKLEKADGDWVVVDKGGFPAETSTLRSLVLSLSNMRKLEAKTSDASNYSQLQVEDQPASDAQPSPKAAIGSTQITLINDAGQTVVDILVGKLQTQGAATGHANSFVRLVNTPQVWLVDGTASLPAESSFWLRASVINLPVESVKTLEIQQPNGSKVVIGRDQPEQEFRLLNQPAGTELLSKKSLAGLAANLAFMELDDVADLSQHPDFASTFAPAPSTAPAAAPAAAATQGKTTFTSFAGLIITADWSPQIAEAGWVKFSASTTADADEASHKSAETINHALGKWLVKLPGFKHDLLTKKLESLVVKAVAP